MERTALCLRRRAGVGKALPALLFFTDPARTPDIEGLTRRLPRGTAIVFRAFGAPDALERARRLKAIAQESCLKLLIGADPALAAAVGADGVHLPQRAAHRARRLKSAHPRWIVTVAAHDVAAARRARGADAVVISAVFPSASASAGAPLGVLRLARMVRQAGRPAYALGGIRHENARRLLASGVAGIAAVDGLART